MTLEMLGLAAALVAALAPWRALPDPTQFSAPAFDQARRAVDNWRPEGVLNLELRPEQALALAVGREIKGLSRCVRLNNYWCVKKAGWTGEIASDDEGHVAFASAADGAAAAAQLLRRYYIDFGLRSARAIVQRWAPAQCGGIVAARGGRRMVGRRLLGPEPRGLTTHGLGSTLRARWLAARRPAAGVRKRGKIAGVRRSVVPDRGAPMMKTPIIAAGVGVAEARETKALPPVRLAMLPFSGTALGPDPHIGEKLPASPNVSCAPETQRIASYATNIAAGIAAGPDADLALFDAEGKPTPNFVQALFNMAAVEIGPLHATQALVDGTVARMKERAQDDQTKR